MFLESGGERPIRLANLTVGAIVTLEFVYPTGLDFAYFIQFIIYYQSPCDAFRVVCQTDPGTYYRVHLW